MGPDDADVTLTGSQGGDAFGMGLLATDLDGDDQDDLVVGAPMYGSYTGRVWLMVVP
jgi:hypothetical protein